MLEIQSETYAREMMMKIICQILSIVDMPFSEKHAHVFLYALNI